MDTNLHEYIEYKATFQTLNTELLNLNLPVPNSLDETISMSELAQPDQFGQFRTVLHRLLYGLRHGQHHVGKLTGWLYSLGIDFDHWQG